MNFELKGIHYDISEKTKGQFDKKFSRLQTAEDNVSSISITVENENGVYYLKETITFKWGSTAFIQAEDSLLYTAIDSLLEKTKTKIVREKEKVQQN